jgi:hypothetical protein
MTAEVGTSDEVARTAVATHTGASAGTTRTRYVFAAAAVRDRGRDGWARAGEVASSLAAARCRRARSTAAARSASIALIQAANRSVYERSSQDAEVAGMGTTMTVALVEDAT